MYQLWKISRLFSRFLVYVRYMDQFWLYSISFCWVLGFYFSLTTSGSFTCCTGSEKQTVLSGWETRMEAGRYAEQEKGVGKAGVKSR